MSFVRFKKGLFFAFSFFSLISTSNAEKPTGTVKLDGSSTVFPVAEAVAEEYGKVQNDVRVTVGSSGTGGGFKKFFVKANNTDISNASRPIKDKELEKGKDLGITFIDLPIAFDGITVVISKENDFVDFLTVEELDLIWGPESQVKYWSDVRKDWPQKEIALFGPGTDSGTFDYFTEVINGKGGKSRSDFTASEDDNVLVKGVASDKFAVGYFGYAYYLANDKTLKAVPIVDKGADKPVSPNNETINTGLYTPLSRPIFIYVNSASLDRAEVKDFVMFFLDKVGNLASEVGYISLPDDVYELGKKFVSDKVTGSKFSGVNSAGRNLADIMNGK